jgi:hypothetical protein
MEGVGGALGDLYGWQSWPTAIAILVEEAMEMSGVALFIYTLLDYVAHQMPTFTLCVSGSRSNTIGEQS